MPKSSTDKATAIRLRALFFAVLDYAAAAVLLLVYAGIGTLTFPVVWRIVALIVVINLLLFAAIASGYSKRFADPALTRVQVAAACFTALYALVVAPPFGYAAIINLFITLSFASLSFDRATYLKAWALLSVSLSFCLYLNDLTLFVPARTPAEKAVFLVFLVGSFARFTAITAAVSRLRETLKRRNQELRQMNEATSRLAMVDELTGLKNRREALVSLARELDRAARNGSAPHVAMIDADHFKRINDRFGHATGDAVLKRLAQLIAGSLRSGDESFRFGGEEFVVLLAGYGEEGARQALDRLRRAVESADWNAMVGGLTVTVSIGLSRLDTSVESALDRADKALYQAKTEGRNRLVGPAQ